MMNQQLIAPSISILFIGLLTACGGERREHCTESECLSSCLVRGFATGSCNADECYCVAGPDGDVDVDSDVDSDTDTDSDVDADSDADGLSCEGVDCSGHGDCVVGHVSIWCDCFPGYEPMDLECVPEAADGDADSDVESDSDDDCENLPSGCVDVCLAEDGSEVMAGGAALRRCEVVTDERGCPALSFTEEDCAEGTCEWTEDGPGCVAADSG